MKRTTDVGERILRNLSKGALTEDEAIFPNDPNVAVRTLEALVASGKVRMEINAKAVGAKRRVYRRTM